MGEGPVVLDALTTTSWLFAGELGKIVKSGLGCGFVTVTVLLVVPNAPASSVTFSVTV